MDRNRITMKIYTPIIMIPEYLSVPVGLKTSNSSKPSVCDSKPVTGVVANTLYDGFMNTVITETFDMEPLRTAKTSARTTRKGRK